MGNKDNLRIDGNHEKQPEIRRIKRRRWTAAEYAEVLACAENFRERTAEAHRDFDLDPLGFSDRATDRDVL